jgi:hypothetical protein
VYCLRCRDAPCWCDVVSGNYVAQQEEINREFKEKGAPDMIAIKPRPKHAQLSITLPEPIYHRVHALAQKYQTPVSQVIAALLERALAKETKEG